MKTTLFWAIAMVATGLFTACNSDDNEPVAVSGITIDPPTLELSIGRTETLAATLTPENATDPTVEWSSNYTDIATVDDAGNVTALKKGDATITAKAGNVTATCLVTVKEPTVYVAGYIGNVATIWKNGEPISLTDGKNVASAKCVYVSGSDVYVTGTEREEGKLGAKLLFWKNGTPTTLTDGKHLADFTSQSIAVSGNDVYVVGTERNDAYNNVAILWKNGVRKNLTDGTGDAYAYAVFVSGTDVYVGGLQYNAAKAHNEATVWKNEDAPVILDKDHYISNINSLFVSDGNIYAAGYTESSMTSPSVATLWENNTPKALSDGTKNTYTSSIFVSGNDVYIAGNEMIDTTHCIAILWKNGVRTNLSDGAMKTEAYSVYVLGNDVYVAGSELNFEKGKYTAILWKNGVRTNLTDGTVNARANSVFIH